MVGRLVVLGVGALLCGGCHDFDALIRHGSDSGTMVDASDDAADGHDATMPCVPGCSGGTWTECIDSKTVEHECALGCATAEACKTISPKWWDEANARRLPRATEDLIVPAHTEWLIWTKATGNDPVIYETPDSKPFPIWIPGKGFPKDFATDAQPDFDWSEEDLGPAGNQKPVVVIWVRDFRVPDTSKVYAWDGRPVIIAASRDIKIDGVFDAGSRPVPLVGGAGAVPKGGWIAELGHPGAGGNGGETSQQNPFSGGWCFGGGGGGYATAGAAGGALFGQTGDGGSAGATVPIQGYVGGAVGGGGGALNTKEFTGAGIGGGVAAFVALGGINVSGGITVGGGAGWGGRSGPGTNVSERRRRSGCDVLRVPSRRSLLGRLRRSRFAHARRERGYGECSLAARRNTGDGR
ncbi:MAG: hypothetical protein R3A78_14335 [Polyangiales bacterium]